MEYRAIGEYNAEEDKALRQLMARQDVEWKAFIESSENYKMIKKLEEERRAKKRALVEEYAVKIAPWYEAHQTQIKEFSDKMETERQELKKKFR
jgi:hypothetical protein